MFYIEKDKPVDIINIINKFMTTDKVRMEKWARYYRGKQDILYKKTEKKTPNKIVVNYCADIVNNYAGYLVGKEVSYNSKNEDATPITDILRYNDVAAEDNELVVSALIHGIAYEQHWIDDEGKERFTALNPLEVIPVYYNDLEQHLAMVIRFYKISNTNDVGLDNYNIEVYYDDRTEYYKAGPSFASLNLVEERPNYYNQIPITVFELNRDKESIFNQIISLQDAYNELISSETDNWDAFVDAYLVLEGMDASPEDVAAMKEQRVLITPEGSDARYITKDVSETQIDLLLNKIDYNIHKISNCPDFSADAFATSSGIALKMKTLGMENTAASISKNLKKAIQKRIELICSILTKTEGEEMWRDMEIIIQRNLPVEYSDIANQINAYRGLVSDRTLISQVPFISDVEAEMEELKKQREAQHLVYDFTTLEDDELLDK